MVPKSNKKPIKKVNIKLNNEISVSEILQKNNTNLTKKDSVRKINTKVLSKENLVGNNLFHMFFCLFDY